LILGIVGDRAVEEDDLAAGLAELLQEQDLVGVLAGQPVGVEDGDDVEAPASCGVPESVKAGPVEAGAGVTLVGVDAVIGEVMSVRRRPGSEDVNLAVDRLLAFLSPGGHPGIDRRTHRSPPLVERSVHVSSSRPRSRRDKPVRPAWVRPASGLPPM
jgi:hypothetical protein